MHQLFFQWCTFFLNLKEFVEGIGSFRNRQALGIVDDQVMAMVRRNDHDRFVPVAMGFDPSGNGLNGGVAAENRTDRVIEVVSVEREVDIARLHEQNELRIPRRREYAERRRSHLGERRLRIDLLGRVLFRRRGLASAAEARSRVITAVGRAEGEMIKRLRAEKAEQPGSAGGGCLSGLK